MKKVSFILVLLGVFLLNEEVYAATYTPTDNLFSSTQSDYLLDMANNQIDNFYNTDFVIFQIDNNYYLVSGDHTINSNSITFNNSTIISAVRSSQGGYYNNYVYSVTTEESTTVNLNYVVISNINSKNTVSSDKFIDYEFKKNLINIGIFILGLCFAIFITKERRY